MGPLGRVLRVAGVLAALVALTVVSLGIAATEDTDDDGPPEPTGVRLEPLGATFAGDFVGDLDVQRPTSHLELALVGTPGPVPADRRASGDDPGLYGASRRVGTCDVEGLLAGLRGPESQARARAWAGVLGIDPAGIPQLVAGLTPVRLRLDTRVTTHAFSGGGAVPVQAILEAGTAVLIDARGVPTVKCTGGNPLLPPVNPERPVEAMATNPLQAWEGFDPEAVVEVEPGDPEPTHVLVDVDDGLVFARPAGTNGQADLAVPPAPEVCGALPASPSCNGDPPPAEEELEVPELGGSSADDARTLLSALGFAGSVAEVTEASELPPGTVLRSEPPAGRLVPSKSPVTLVVSGDPPPPPPTTATTTTTLAQAAPTSLAGPPTTPRPFPPPPPTSSTTTTTTEPPTTTTTTTEPPTTTTSTTAPPSSTSTTAAATSTSGTPTSDTGPPAPPG